MLEGRDAATTSRLRGVPLATWQALVIPQQLQVHNLNGKLNAGTGTASLSARGNDSGITPSRRTVVTQTG